MLLTHCTMINTFRLQDFGGNNTILWITTKKQKRVSHTHWVVIAKEVSGRPRPTFAFVKAVYNYYHSNLKNVRGSLRVLELLENKGKDSIMVRNMYCSF